MGEFQCLDFDFFINAGGMWWTSVVKSKWMMLRQPLSGNLRNNVITVVCVLAVAKLDEFTQRQYGLCGCFRAVSSKAITGNFNNWDEEEAVILMRGWEGAGISR